jgi:hypothetical protein
VTGIPLLLAWLPVPCVALYLKYRIINQPSLQQPLMRVDMRSLGRLGQLPFYRTDIPLGFLLIPAVLMGLAVLLPRSWRGPVIASVSAIYSVLIYLDYVCFLVVARLFSFGLAREALAWARSEPAAVGLFFTSRGIGALAALILAIALLSGWGARRGRIILQNPDAERRWRRGALLMAGLVSAFAAILWVPRVSASAHQESIIANSVASLVNWNESPASESSGLSVPVLARAYRTLANAPGPSADSRFWGKAQGADLVFIIFESGAFRFMPLDQSLDDFPNLRRLRARSFVALEHYTTFPYNDRALFSLFSSWYPPNLEHSFFQQHINLAVPGVMRTLSARGYRTAIYDPYKSSKMTGREFQLLGFQRCVFAKDPLSERPDYEERWSLDLAAWKLLTQDVDRWESQGQRFAVAFTPKSGHFPLAERNRGGQRQTVVEMGRAAAARQDAFLGELARVLEARHRLDQTLIVVTSNHGVRAPLEDPSLPLGVVDECSYHVPLLIYAPQALKQPENIAWLTSHIDVAPTLLDLLGVERDRDAEQGAPIWDSRLPQRTTFFFGANFCGADAYYSQGQFSMRNAVTGAAYQSGCLQFAAGNAVPPASTRFAEVNATLRRMIELQRAWAEGWAKR